MPQSTAMLTQLSGGYDPLAGGIAPDFSYPFRGVPGFGGSGMLGAAGMLLSPQLYGMFGRAGMVPMGIGHDQNVYDSLLNQSYMRMRMQAMQVAAESDRRGYMETMRGLAALTGTPFGSEQRRAAQSVSNALVTASPLLAQFMPDVLDQMGGLRGSATVMTNRMMDAGRYRIDPLTGQMGMSAATAGFESRRLYDDLFSNQNIAAMRGLSAGQVGAMFSQLQSRGMVAGTGTDVRAEVRRAVEDITRESPERMRRIARETGVKTDRGLGGLSGEDLDKLQMSGEVAERVRSFDADKVKRTLKSYVNVVSAMRDIFGDMGKPNAPMNELIAGVEALTAGSAAQLDPGRLAGMVRQTYNLARQTGVSMDNALIVQQHAAARAHQMGLEPVFGVTATQGSLGFGGAYRAMGGAANTAWGAMTADQLQQLDANLRVQAAGSNMANRMAVAMRVAEQAGGFQKGSDAAGFAQAIRLGLNQYQGSDGKMHSLMTGDAEFIRMMTGARGANGQRLGLSEGDILSMLGQRDTNRAMVDRYGMVNTVRRAQGPDELHPFVGYQLQSTLAARLRDQLVRQGVAGGEAQTRANKLAAQISQGAVRDIFTMTPEAFADDSRRTAGVAEILGSALTASGADPTRGMSAEDRQTFLRQTADIFYGQANRAIMGSQYRAFGNLQNVFRLTNQATLNEADRQQMQAAFTGEMQNALSPLGHGSLLASAVDALQHTRANDRAGMQKVLAQALGGVKISDLNKTLMPQFQRIRERQQAVQDLEKKMLAASTPEQKAQIAPRLESARRELERQSKELARLGDQFGLTTQEDSREDVEHALSSTADVMRAQNVTVGLRGGFGDEVSEDQIKRVRAARQNDKAKEYEARAVLIARRGVDLDALTKWVKARDTVAHLEDVKGRTEDQEAQLRDAKAIMDGKDTTPTGAQMATLKQYANIARGLPGGGQLNDAQAERMGLRIMRDTLGNLPLSLVRQNMAHLDIQSDAEARALLRANRRALPYRASRKDIQEILDANKGQITEAEAEELANLRLQALRLGVEKEDYTAEGEQLTPQQEMSRIADKFKEKADKQFEVSDDDRKEFLKTFPNMGNPSEKELNEFKDQNKDLVEGKSDDEVKTEMLNRIIRKTRKQESDRRFEDFWRNEGQAFQDSTDRAMQDVETAAHSLVQSPLAVQRLGTRAVEMSRELLKGQDRLRELAALYSRGDVARLLAGHHTIDTSTKKGMETLAKLRTEVTDIQRHQRSVLLDWKKTQGVAGHHFRLGSEEAARRQVMEERIQERIKAEPGTDKATIRREEEQRFLTSNVSPTQQRMVEARAAELGSDREVKRFLGYENIRDLSEFQLSRMAGVRYGAGNEEEAIGLYGRERWDGLSEKEKRDTLARLRQGTGDRDGAMKLLGITEEMLKDPAQNRDELEDRIKAAQEGLLSEAHARGLAGIGVNEDLSRLPAEERKRAQDAIQAAKTGIGTTDWARNRMGLAEDQLSPELRQRIVKAREQAGNREEAMRLKGWDLGRKLTGKEQKELDQLTYDVDMTRRLRGHEQFLTAYYDRAGRLDELAKKTGKSVAEVRKLIAKGKDVAGLSPAAREYFITDVNAQDRDDATLRQLAAGLGIDPNKARESLAGVPGVLKALKGLQQSASRELDQNPQDTVRDILKAYDFHPGQDLNATERRMAGLLEGTQGRWLGRQILSTAKTLRGRAEQGGDKGLAGVDAMAAAYRDATRIDLKADEREKRLKAFQDKYKFGHDASGKLTSEGESEFSAFERAMQFQDQMGFLYFGRGGSSKRRYSTEERGLELLERRLGGETAQTGGEHGMPGRIEMSGTVNVNFADRTMNMSDVWGATRDSATA